MVDQPKFCFTLEDRPVSESAKHKALKYFQQVADDLMLRNKTKHKDKSIEIEVLLEVTNPAWPF